MSFTGDILTSDSFCGGGGSSLGLTAVPGVSLRWAANHNKVAIATHEMHFPEADHYRGDLHAAEFRDFPYVHLAWHSPECTTWTQARGKRRDYAVQEGLFPQLGEKDLNELTMRSRALMEDVPRYLRAVRERYGRPVLAGVIENVVDVRKWTGWKGYLKEFRKQGYKVRVISFNSAHARPHLTQNAPQSRDRLYICYWHESLGRDPDWDKWLRPVAWCATCGEDVRAIQAFKKPTDDVGKYGIQYVYRCPRVTCRNSVVQPYFTPAASIINWQDLGVPIGESRKILVPKTRARILAGIQKFSAEPFLYAAAGHTFERRPGVRTWSLSWPTPAQMTTNTLALATPPTFPAMVMRNNTEDSPGCMSTSPWEPFRTVTTKGHQSIVTWQAEAARQLALLVPYYSTGVARPVTLPAGTVSTKDRFGLATTDRSPAEWTDADLDEVFYRMLQVGEVTGIMAFPPGYTFATTKHTEQVMMLGNAVTPPVAELLASALAETIRGEPIDWDLAA